MCTRCSSSTRAYGLKSECGVGLRSPEAVDPAPPVSTIYAISRNPDWSRCGCEKWLESRPAYRRVLVKATRMHVDKTTTALHIQLQTSDILLSCRFRSLCKVALPVPSSLYKGLGLRDYTGTSGHYELSSALSVYCVNIHSFWERSMTCMSIRLALLIAVDKISTTFGNFLYTRGTAWLILTYSKLTSSSI